jgi:hypothetical protein
MPVGMKLSVGFRRHTSRASAGFMCSSATKPTIRNRRLLPAFKTIVLCVQLYPCEHALHMDKRGVKVTIIEAKL